MSDQNPYGTEDGDIGRGLSIGILIGSMIWGLGWLLLKVLP